MVKLTAKKWKAYVHLILSVIQTGMSPLAVHRRTLCASVWIIDDKFQRRRMTWTETGVVVWVQVEL